MYHRNSGQYVKSPFIHAGSYKHHPRVVMICDGKLYHLEPAEAMNIANRLVDAAESAPTLPSVLAGPDEKQEEISG